MAARPHRRRPSSLLFLLGLATVAGLALMIWAVGYLGDPAVRSIAGDHYEFAANRFGINGVPHLLAGLYLLLLATGAVAFAWLVWLAGTAIGDLVLRLVAAPVVRAGRAAGVARSKASEKDTTRPENEAAKRCL